MFDHIHITSSCFSAGARYFGLYQSAQPGLRTVILTLHHSYLGNPCEVEFNFTRTTPEEIVEIIRKMKPKSSSGLENISCRLMKDIFDIIAIPLTSLINQSLQSGIFPDKLKIA